MRPHLVRTGLVLAGVLAGAAIAVAATNAPPRPRVLARIEPGQWVLRDSDGGPSRSLCVADPSTLIQLAHPAGACSRVTLSDAPARGQVHYTCPGHGHGDTTIRVETPSLIHIDSQGIADNAPFNMSIEARRTGECRR
jgi:hypothetical protein